MNLLDNATDRFAIVYRLWHPEMRCSERESTGGHETNLLVEDEEAVPKLVVKVLSGARIFGR